MLILLYLMLLIVGILAVHHAYERYNAHLIYKLPGPRPILPYLGHAFISDYTFAGLWQTCHRVLNDYYPTTCLWLFTKPLVLIRHPDDIKIILKSKSNIEKADSFYAAFTRLQKGGIVTSGGKKWHERRKLMTKAMHRNTLFSIAEIANKYSELLIQQMLGWGDESIQNVLPMSMKFSLHVICDSAMSYDLCTVDAQYEEEYREAFEELIYTIVYRLIRSFLKDWMVKYLPLGRKQYRLSNILKDFTRRIIEKRRKYHEANGNLLFNDLAIDFEKNNANLGDSEVKSLKELNVIDTLLIFNAKGLIDDKGMADEIEQLIAAGYDTTGYAVAYTLLLLAENENEQNLARKEVIDAMKKSGNKLTVPELQNLQYLECCIKESLRLFPSGPIIGRRLVEDTQLNGYLIPRNTDVFMSIFEVHRDPKFWPEPNKFNPDRFLPEFSKDRHPYAYLPFSSGLRNCIGQKHAMIEAKIVIAHILYNFYLKPIDFTHKISFDLHLSLKPTSNKLRVKFIKILQHI